MGEEMSKTLSKIGKHDLCILDKEDHSYAAYDGAGVEYLFYMNKLCLIQFDISRIRKIIWVDHEIQYNTTYIDFKN